MKVIVLPEAREQYNKLPISMRERVSDVFVRLAKWPEVSGAKPLRGDLAGSYRIRTGDYRIVFRIDSMKDGGQIAKVVAVWKIGNRKDVYLD